MKNKLFNFRLLTLFLALATFTSCKFNQSVSTDMQTGAYSRGDGITVGDVLIEVNGKPENSSEFLFGQKVNLIFNNVNGLTNTNGKTYPELSMSIVKNDKDTIVSNPNMLTSLSDGTDLDPLQIQTNFTTALPNQHGEKYKLYVEISDNNGEGKYNYELPFTIEKYDLLDIQTNGIDYSLIYLWDETTKQAINENNIDADHSIYLILKDVEGLTVENGMVYPSFSIDMTDNTGHKIFSNPDLLSVYALVGVSSKDVKDQVTAKLTFSQGIVDNPCTLTAKLKDNKSSKDLSITTKLNLN